MPSILRPTNVAHQHSKLNSELVEIELLSSLILPTSNVIQISVLTCGINQTVI